jgi:hypothetical protein
MKLSLEGLQQSGGFTGAPVKREIEWVRGDHTETYDVYVRRLSFQTAVSDVHALAGHGDLAANRIAHSICDEHGARVFKVSDITGINDDGSPVLNEDGTERGGIDNNLTLALLSVIGEVNGLGKKGPPISRKRKKSGTS